MKRPFLASSISLFISLSLLASAFAGDFRADFEALRDIPEDYQNEGAICEQIARLRLQEEYPAPRYDVVVGVEYLDGLETIGELDVVVFGRDERRVVLVGEVKCWIDLSRGIVKAHTQRQRFLDHLGGPHITFRNAGTKRAYRPELFTASAPFITISQEGGLRHGFDREIDYDLDELKEFRKRMMSCQAQGECARFQRRR